MSAMSTEAMRLGPHSLVDPPLSSGGRRRGEDPSPSRGSLREVVACLDGSELGRGLVPHAQVIARALGARLTLLHVLETEATSAVPPDPVEWGIRRSEARVHLAGLAAELGDLEETIHAELIQGRAAEQICSWVERHDVDLTVLCSHGARGVTDWDLASTARKLIDRTPGSVMLVPAGAAAGCKEVRYGRILVPLDGSPRAESVVPLAMRIAASEQAEILFVHVVPVPEITRMGPLDAEGAELERRVVEHNQRVAEAYLDRLRARASQAGARVRALVVEDGNVRTRLERLIRDESADLVVMSAHGYTGRVDAACGSITEYVLTHAKAPLLVVRERQRQRTRRGDPAHTRPLERLGSSAHDN